MQISIIVCEERKTQKMPTFCTANMSLGIRIGLLQLCNMTLNSARSQQKDFGFSVFEFQFSFQEQNQLFKHNDSKTTKDILANLTNPSHFVKKIGHDLE